MSGLDPTQVALLVLAALCVGFAKTAVSGTASISVALFAAVLPARESTGALLPLLILGDVVAVSLYRQHADWAVLLRLFPSVAVGVVGGAAFVANVGDTGMRRTIGVVLLVLVVVHLWQRRRDAALDPDTLAARRHASRHASAAAFGILAGFTTMVANAGGPAMAIYLLRSGVGMLGFLGTTAWFFATVNVFKLPFSAGLGLLTGQTLVLLAWLAPAVLLGAGAGRAIIGRIDQARFEALVLVFVVLSSANLLR